MNEKVNVDNIQSKIDKSLINKSFQNKFDDIIVLESTNKPI